MKNSTLLIDSVSGFNRHNVSYNGQGVSGQAIAGQLTNIDYKLTDDNFLTGGQLNVKNGAWGDTCHMQVVDADQSMKGVQIPEQPSGVTFDMLPTYPLLAQFFTNCQIMDGAQRQQTFSSPYPAKILAGMTLRIAYTSTGTVGPLVAVNYDLHKALT